MQQEPPEIIEEYGPVDGIDEREIIDAVQVGEQPVASLIIKTGRDEYHVCYWDSPDNRWAMYGEAFDDDYILNLWLEFGNLITEEGEKQ